MGEQLELYNLFKQPTAAFRGKPFWSWNGTLDKAELLRQLEVFKEMGFGGVFMHSRTGLATEYLGDEWFDLINACAEEAEKLGMEAWLYDEDRWPSGTAGGIVTEEPRFRLKFIRLQIVSSEQFVWKDDVIAAFQCRIKGMVFTDLKRLSQEQEQAVETQAGTSILVFTITEQQKESFYNGYTYLDTLNREAVDKFIELTHEKYKSKSGKHFGKAIKGIFTDEPHRGTLMDGFGIDNEAKEWHSPWTYTLFERFEAAYGYDLIEKLPELFLKSEGQSFSQVKWHYVDLLQEMFQDNFAKPIQAWCEANDLILTGHILHEDNLTAQTAMVGSVMRYYEHMDYPGVDVLTEGNLNYWVVKQLSSAARQLGKKWLLSELYGCTGWQMPLEAHKAVGDWQALFGINLRCHHLSWYTMAGEAKRDYPASISYQSAWWQDYDYVEAYFSRLGVVLSQGDSLCDLLVLNPVESLWGQIYPGWSRNLSPQSPEVQALEQIYQNTFHWLTGEQIDFDYGDEEMLSRLGSVSVNSYGEVVFLVGKSAYRSILVTGMLTMRASSLQLLEQFKQAGGSVIFAGEVPSYVDALASNAVQELARNTVHVPFTKHELLDTCRITIPTHLTLFDLERGKVPDEIYAQLRVDEASTYIVLMNMNRENWISNVRVSIEGKGSMEEWFCTSGERGYVESVNVDGKLEFMVDFPPSGEHVYVMHTEKNAKAVALKPVIRRSTAAVQDLTGPYDYTLDEPNVCVLDWAAYKVNDGDWQPAQEILQVDRAIRDILGMPYRTGSMIQPWYTQKFNPFALEGKAEIELSFTFGMKEIPTGPLYLAIEKPEHFQICFNGHELAADEVTEWWVDRCFVKIAIPAAYCLLGNNAVELKTLYHQGIDLEAIYILGEFGVLLAGNHKTINRLPEQLAIGCITQQGFPFYGGLLSYFITNDKVKAALELLSPKELKANDEIMLSLPNFEAACIKVRTSGRADQMIAWQPYEAEISDIAGLSAADSIRLDVILTRRNTFGPLHQLPLLTWAYGPENWVTEGEKFSADYVLMPAGLLSAPQLIRKIAIQTTSTRQG
ncbi:hypothetical protein EHS13_27150 [Paenibacillus psychroresistens]|uniref:Glycoside hydrolase n=1 Tax=Paenibacillus psychroresistens TaxID=1778678 RepID=A0A6B8RQN0_9BACL|nr:glycosyl hydrolase [Paenibacillus psychroresistens]QGQ98299.1 hypothetical protein EHS13_27150 [Paenibacillus psychroresistens]